MKRNSGKSGKWRRGKPPHTPKWLAAAANKLGLVGEVRDTPIRKMTLNDMVSPSDPPLTGMIFNHWIVGQTALKGDYKPKRVHICVSKCGTVCRYEPWEIESGRLPETCFECDPSKHAPPKTRNVPECSLPTILEYWKEGTMATVLEERSGLKSHEGTQLWVTSGRPVITEIVARTPYGQLFGWKVYIKEYTDLRAAIPKAHRVKILAVNKGERKFELFVQKAGGAVGFRVDLSTGRTDVPFPQIISTIENSVKILQSLDDGSNEMMVPLAAAAELNGSHSNGYVDLAKLVKIKAGIDNLLTVGKDINELAGLKAAARKKVEHMNAKKGDLHVKLIEANGVLELAKGKANAARERVHQCEMTLRNAIATRDNFIAGENDAIARAEEAERLYEPAESEAKEAEEELAELERLEADRLKSVGDAKGLATLLEALGHLGG